MNRKPNEPFFRNRLYSKFPMNQKDFCAKNAFTFHIYVLEDPVGSSTYAQLRSEIDEANFSIKCNFKSKK